MTGVDIQAALDGAPEFVADAVERLTVSLGETHPTVLLGRRVMASLVALPQDAVLVTEESLAAAMHRAWPFRRNTPTNLGLSAALILAALRADGAKPAPRPGRRGRP
jgi:hypothetical protein